ncbi:hypothetical protein [Actinomadura fibrosa]|uniref:Uncharacterized protein n=1 Tax=Actinomadura fibrosa TaxID=111802 RepID=A0ABW2XGB9_9ACTN|nr:hypothetical protein [Actinomadura fibrosa]
MNVEAAVAERAAASVFRRPITDCWLAVRYVNAQLSPSDLAAAEWTAR